MHFEMKSDDPSWQSWSRSAYPHISIGTNSETELTLQRKAVGRLSVTSYPRNQSTQYILKSIAFHYSLCLFGDWDFNEGQRRKEIAPRNICRMPLKATGTVYAPSNPQPTSSVFLPPLFGHLVRAHSSRTNRSSSSSSRFRLLASLRWPIRFALPSTIYITTCTDVYHHSWTWRATPKKSIAPFVQSVPAPPPRAVCPVRHAHPFL